MEERPYQLLADLTNRDVYNYGVGGGSVNNTLYALKQDDLYEKMPEPPEYVIYTWIVAQRPRPYTIMYNFSNILNVRYFPNHNKIEEYKLNPILSKLMFLFSVKKFTEAVDIYYNYEDSYARYENSYSTDMYEYKNIFNPELLFRELIKECRKEIQKRYPNVKFVILLYRERLFYHNEEYDNKIWQDLKDDGFIVIDSYDLVGDELNSDKYILSQEDEHPNAEAWKILMPKFVNYLNL